MKKTYTVSERKMAGVYSDTITKICGKIRM